jgi:hypothetical protein
MASREVIESLGAFLRRSTALSDDDIRERIKDIDEGRMRTPDSSSEPFRRAIVIPSAEATRIPDDGSPKNGRPAVPSGATKLEEPTAGRGSISGSGNPRLAGLRARHPPVRAPVTFPEHALEAADVPADDVRTRLAHFNNYVAARVQAGELPCVDLPDLHRANSIYDQRGNVFLGHNVRRLAFDRQGGKAFMRILLTLETAPTTFATVSAPPSGDSSTTIRRSSPTRARARSTAIVRSRGSRMCLESGGRASASSRRAGA